MGVYANEVTHGGPKDSLRMGDDHAGKTENWGFGPSDTSLSA